MRIGPKESTLDDKGRIIIPKVLRELYRGKLVITWGLERCAWVMTEAFFNEKFTKRLNSDDLTQEERLTLEDKHINMAEDVEMDSQGRIAISTPLRKYARLTKECMVLNAENRLAIWDMETYSAYLDKNEEIARQGFNKLKSKNLFGTKEE